MPSKSSETPIVDDYLDCTGRMRHFKLEPYAEGLFLEAVELRDGEPVGLRFIMGVNTDGQPPYGQIRDRIRERLSQRDLVHDPQSGKLESIHNLIRVQLDELDDDGTPMLLVDDMRISWRALGRLLERYNGYGLRIQICECGEE
jgi:hypothetical protein